MNNTIFDDVFRTMIEKMPYLAVPLINEVFHTSYPEDVKITQLRNEHQQENGEVITDSCLLIGKKMYHIECQSTDDTTMAIRMIEYDFAISIEHAEKQGRRYRIEFPKSCVLFLRSSENTPDYLEADVAFPDGNTYLYSILTIKMADYTIAVLVNNASSSSPSECEILRQISLPCVSTPADIFLVFRTLLNCLKCIIY